MELLEKWQFSAPESVHFESSSGTICSQSIDNARGSSRTRSPESVCYKELLLAAFRTMLDRSWVTPKYGGRFKPTA